MSQPKDVSSWSWAIRKRRSLITRAFRTRRPVVGIQVYYSCSIKWTRHREWLDRDRLRFIQYWRRALEPLYHFDKYRFSVKLWLLQTFTSKAYTPAYLGDPRILQRCVILVDVRASYISETRLSITLISFTDFICKLAGADWNWLMVITSVSSDSSFALCDRKPFNYRESLIQSSHCNYYECKL